MTCVVHTSDTRCWRVWDSVDCGVTAGNNMRLATIASSWGTGVEMVRVVEGSQEHSSSVPRSMTNP